MEQEQIKYVAYYRVSKQKKRNGLKVEVSDDYSMKDQELLINDFIEKEGGTVIGSFCEFVSGRNDQRVEARKAIELCKKEGAVVLVGLFSRVMRSLPFLMMLRAEQVKFRATDFKDANEFMCNILCCVYEYQTKESNAKIKRSLKIVREIKGEWRVNNLTDEGRRKAAQSKSQKFLTNEMLMLGSHIKSLKSNGLGTARIADEIKNSPFKNLIPDINKNKVESLLRVQSRMQN